MDLIGILAAWRADLISSIGGVIFSGKVNSKPGRRRKNKIQEEGDRWVRR
jgi:hypothetical protein